MKELNILHGFPENTHTKGNHKKLSVYMWWPMSILGLEKSEWGKLINTFHFGTRADTKKRPSSEWWYFVDVEKCDKVPCEDNLIKYKLLIKVSHSSRGTFREGLLGNNDVESRTEQLRVKISLTKYLFSPGSQHSWTQKKYGDFTWELFGTFLLHEKWHGQKAHTHNQLRIN